MAELAAETKQLDFQLEQVQDFTPTPMTIATETWYTGYDPYTLEKVFSAKSPREKEAQRQFFFWYKPEERASIEKELRRIGRADLIEQLYEGMPKPYVKDYRKQERQDGQWRQQPKGRKSFNPNFNNDNKRPKDKGRKNPANSRGRKP